MRVSLIVVGVFGLMAGLATWFVVKLQRAEISETKKESDAYKLEMEKKIADSNARMKEAELALAKYKQPRNLDVDSFLAKLKGAPPRNVEVLYVRECSDCSWVAQFIGSFLNTATWKATWAPIDEKAAATGPWRMQPSAISVRGYPWGITIVANDISPEVYDGPKGVSLKALFEALLASYAPSVTMALDREMPDGLIRVVVAPKP